MHLKSLGVVVSLSMLSLLGAAAAQTAAPASAPAVTTASPNAPAYDPRLTFAPLALPEPVNAYRSSNGAPGPSYWQNEADYEMHATLDTAAKILRQRRDDHLHQQQRPTRCPACGCTSIRTSTARTRAARSSRRALSAVRRRGSASSVTPPPTASSSIPSRSMQESIRQSRLRRGRHPHADSPRLSRGAQRQPQDSHRISLPVPGVWGGRTSWGMSKKGEIYDMAQWYPRMAVYDDLRGWDTLPYIGS